MPRFTTVEARERFADIINRVAYGKDRVVLTRRGKQVAAVVPIEDLKVLQQMENDKPLQRGEPHPMSDESLDETAARERLRPLAQTPGHQESLLGAARPFVRRWPAPDADWDEAVAQAAAEEFLAKTEEAQ